jgi:hypothetical protein
LAPVTVTVVVPAIAVVEAVRVRMLLAPAADAGLKAAVTPPGRPLALSATAAVNPPVRVMPIVLVPLAPTAMLRLAGLADREKSGV